MGGLQASSRQCAQEPSNRRRRGRSSRGCMRPARSSLAPKWQGRDSWQAILPGVFEPGEKVDRLLRYVFSAISVGQSTQWKNK